MTATMQPKSEAAEEPRRGERTPGAGVKARPRRGACSSDTGGGRCPASPWCLPSTTWPPESAASSPLPTGRASARSRSWAGQNFEAIFKDPTKLGALSNTLFLAFGSVSPGQHRRAGHRARPEPRPQDALHPPHPLLHAGGAQPARHGLHLEVHLRLRRSAQRLPHVHRRRRPGQAVAGRPAVGHLDRPGGAGLELPPASPW